jgi:RHS repeat-associated protein
VTSIAYPGVSNTVTDNYNIIDQLASIVDPASRTTSFGYNADGAPTTTTAANGTVATIAYNTANQPTSSALTDGATALGTITYARNADGDLTGTAPTSGAPGSTTTYSYNSNEQLTGATVGSTTTGYAYDSVGNPTTVGNATQAFDPSGELCWSTTSTVTSPTCGTVPSGATTYSFNGDGQRTASTPTTGSATNYAYNSAGELSGVSGAVLASYTYNGDGLRASKTAGGTTTTFTYDTNGQVPLLLTDGTNDYVYGPTGAPVEQFTPGGGSPQYYFSDTHGSTQELTSGTGATDATYSYSAWGVTTAHTGTASTPIEFGAAYTDSESGLLYLDYRYYDPATALFLSADPLVELTHAAYSFVGDNPLNLLDPIGLLTTAGWWAVAGAVGLGLVIVGLAATGVGLAADAPLGALEAADIGAVAADATADAVTDAAADGAASAAEDGAGDAASDASNLQKVAKAVKIPGRVASAAGTGADAGDCFINHNSTSCVAATFGAAALGGDIGSDYIPDSSYSWGAGLGSATTFGITGGIIDGVSGGKDIHNLSCGEYN